MDVLINEKRNFLPKGAIPLDVHGHYYPQLLRCLGYALPPLADLLRRYHGLDGAWLIVTPLVWQASHNDVVLLAAGADMDWTPVIARQYFSSLHDFLAVDGMRLHYHDDVTWLLSCDGLPALTAAPVDELIHLPMMQALKNLDKSHYWSRLLTEIQMLWAPYVNEGQACNGVWIWGGGDLNATVSRPIIAYDDQALRIACGLSSEVSLHNAALSIKKQSLFLCTQLSDEEYDKLRQQLKRHTVNWYWQDCAYQTRASSWWRL